MGIKVLKREEILEIEFLDYKLQYSGDYESGNIRTNILDKESSQLVKVIQTSKKIRKDKEIWITHIYDDKTQRIDMSWENYEVNPDVDLIKKEGKGKEITSFKMHEKILTAILKDLKELPIKEQEH